MHLENEICAYTFIHLYTFIHPSALQYGPLFYLIILFSCIGYVKLICKTKHAHPDLHHVAMQASSYDYDKSVNKTVIRGLVRYNVEHNVSNYCDDTRAEK
jgi:hypothetical protein